jgi:hypothetical protein
MARLCAFMVTVVAVFGVVSACSRSGVAGSGGSATIALVATIGPTQPVCRVGHACSAPYHGRVLLRSEGQTSVITTGHDGRGQASIPPGTYEIHEQAGLPFPRLASVTMNGRPVARDDQGGYVLRLIAGPNHVRLAFDTGIR